MRNWDNFIPMQIIFFSVVPVNTCSVVVAVSLFRCVYPVHVAFHSLISLAFPLYTESRSICPSDRFLFFFGTYMSYATCQNFKGAAAQPKVASTKPFPEKAIGLEKGEPVKSVPQM